MSGNDGSRSTWILSQWETYVTRGIVPRGWEPKVPPTTQNQIRDLIALEITGTALDMMITRPFLQRELDPVLRFPEGLDGGGRDPASLYCQHSQAGSWTVSLNVILATNR
jgi:hypothetical protein